MEVPKGHYSCVYLATAFAISDSASVEEHLDEFAARPNFEYVREIRGQTHRQQFNGATKIGADAGRRTAGAKCTGQKAGRGAGMTRKAREEMCADRGKTHCAQPN